MKKVYYGLLSLLCAGLVSCAKDEAQSSLKGRIDVRVNTDQSLSDEVSRAAEEVTEPDLNDFALTIASVDGEVSNSWDSFEKFEPVFVEVGTYTVIASYGEAESEGFDALSYLGSTNVEVRKDETVEAAVTCTINKAKVSVSYTDDFKKYFSSYSAYVSSSKGNKVTYAADETRGAYFVPGDLGLFLEVTRQGISQKITLNPKNFTAEVKHEYRLTMDVDASTASLKIVFNDNPASEQNVSINISDEALNAAPPVFTPYGFESGTPLEVLEGETVSDKLEAYLNAPVGLTACELTTTSEALKAQGWPEKVDLMNLTAEQSQKLTELGLSTRGLGANHDKIALIDFRDVLSHLYCVTDGDDTHVFTLKATDALTKVSDLVLNVTTRNNGFAITLPESVPYGSTTMTADLTLEGNPALVKFFYFYLGVDQEFRSENINIQPGTEENKYKVTFTYPEPLVDTENVVKFKAQCGAKTFESTFKVEDPELTLSLKNGDADVWATKAYLQVTASAKSRASRTISSSTVEIQYKEGKDWKAWPHQSYDAETGLFLLTGLGEGASETAGVSYILRAVYKRGGEAVSLSEELSITTEPKAQVGNAGFEEWHTEIHVFKKSGVLINPTEEREWYLPWNTDESDVWWAVNSRTTMPSECAGGGFYEYKVFPTISWSSSNKSQGEKSIQIATIAVGKAAIVNGGSTTPHVGEIWIGTANDNGDHASEGHAFVSRPSSLSFWYQYESFKDEEKFYMQVVLKAADGTIVASNEIPNGVEGDPSGNTITLPFTYSSDVHKKVSSIYMVFKSSSGSVDSEKRTMEISGQQQTARIGSVLRIDDIKLNYE
ncbi:DUF4493 domain-containing protein [Phocaeicola plebeius]|uniref:DUF4493 domain-containing protein n=1 Tax=Phocaeicola plebeius TaxID=310297 RepID=UPI0026E993B0|nr:DUF4493 domain-containing protein [Phocaeicola plebeius]MCI6050396.1 DUF4493 domain-containing protein [Phocaeicola plebeius]MDD6914493.1 DUF4493 domain-containing protein [Phocaeicola plebeius]MDY5978215.1 DUF4493 domain-containing protein [Phocaeicola plebeius]